MKPILIHKTGRTIPSIAVDSGDFEDWIIAGMGLPPRQFLTTSVFLDEALPSLSAISAVVVTGSPAMVTEELAWIKQSEAFLLEAVKAEMPVLGICFGHQLLAKALGGKVGWHKQGREIGTTTVELGKGAESDILFAGLPDTFPVHVSHMQSVLEPPSGSAILASNDFDPHHGLCFAKNAWGIQFHPEFNENITSLYIRERYDQIKSEGLDPDVLLSKVEPAPASASILGRFAALVTEREADQEA